MKKIIKIVLVMLLMVTLFPSQVQAKEDQSLLRLSSISIENSSDKYGEKVNVLFDIDTKESNVNFDQLVLTWDANGIEQSMVFSTFSHEVEEVIENKYKAQSYFPTGHNYETENFEFEKGDYTLKSITIHDDANKTFSYIREDNLWKTIVKGGDFTLIKDNKITEPAIIKNISTSTSFDSLTMPFEESVSLEIECQDGVIPELTFLYYSEDDVNNKNVHYLEFELDQVKTGSHIYQFNLNSKSLLKYGITDFKIAAIITTARHLGTGMENDKKILYSHLDNAILDEIYFVDDPNIERKQLNDLEKLNIHLVNDIKKDETAPILKNIAFKNTVVTEPGVAYLDIDIEEENEIENIGMSFLFDNGHIAYANGSSLEDMNHFPVWFESKLEVGKARLMDIFISDYAGNKSVYVVKGLEDKTDYESGFYETIDVDCSIEVKPYMEFEAIYDLDENILTQLESMKENMTYVLNTSKTKYVNKEIFDSIKGKNITLIFEDLYDFEKPQWIINGKEIINETKDINLATRNQYMNAKLDFSYGDLLIVYGIDKDIAGATKAERNQYILDVVNSYEGAKYYQDYLKKYDKEKDDLLKIFSEEYEKHTVLRLIFSNNGLLPGKMVVRIKDTDNYFVDNELNLYFIGSEGEYSLVQKNIKKAEDGFYDMTITHNSAYLLLLKELTEEEKEEIEEVEKPSPGEETEKPRPEEDDVIKPVPEDTATTQKPETLDSSNIYQLLYLLILASGLIYISMKRKTVND